jgi:hypothetical protein
MDLGMRAKNIPKRAPFIAPNMTFLASQASILGFGMWSTAQHLVSIHFAVEDLSDLLSRLENIN